MGIAVVGDVAGVVEEDGHDLVVGDRVEGQEGVGYEVDDGLPGKNLFHAGWLDLDGDPIGAGQFSLRQQRC